MAINRGIYDIEKIPQGQKMDLSDCCTAIFQREPAGWIVFLLPGSAERQVSGALCFIGTWNGVKKTV